jgi:hypothetical protein
MFLHGPPVHNDDYQRRWDDPEGHDHNYDSIKTIFEGPTEYAELPKIYCMSLSIFLMRPLVCHWEKERTSVIL